MPVDNRLPYSAVCKLLCTYYTELMSKQLNEWGCIFDDLIVGHRDNPKLPTKPSYDLIIDDKAKRIEEL